MILRSTIALILLAASAQSYAAPSISNVTVTPVPTDSVISAPNKTLVTIGFRVSDSNVTALNFLPAGFLNGASCNANKIGVKANAIQSAKKPTVDFGIEKSGFNNNLTTTYFKDITASFKLKKNVLSVPITLCGFNTLTGEKVTQTFTLTSK